MFALIETKVDRMKVSVYESNENMGKAAADEAAEYIKKVLAEKGEANIIFATANSQQTFFDALPEQYDIDWSKVNVFHMDEYIGLPPNHPVSFREMLKSQFISRLKQAPKSFHSLPVEDRPLEDACVKHEKLLKQYPADLCVMGIGENGHLAFNDPPYACFNDERWVKIVKLDERSRIQQVNEGHFKSLEDVPTHAMTFTIPALLSAGKIICIVPEKRKAEAVKEAVYGPISEDCPASILKQYDHVHLVLDQDAATLILSNMGVSN